MGGSNRQPHESEAARKSLAGVGDLPGIGEDACAFVKRQAKKTRHRTLRSFDMAFGGRGAVVLLRQNTRLSI